MTVQTIDFANATSATYNGTALTQILFDGSVVWPYVAPTGVDVTTAFVPFVGFNVTDNASDTSANYSVSEIQFDASGSNKRIYIGHKITAATTYYNDTPIGAIQILNAAGTTVIHNWQFRYNTNSWQTISRNVGVGNTIGSISETPTQAASLSYYNITTGGTDRNRFNHRSNTGSSQTGAVDGINDGSTPMTLGNATMAQTSGANYIYREASGSQSGSITYMRSPLVNISAGQILRIAYIMGNSSSSSNMQRSSDTLFLGIP